MTKYSTIYGTGGIGTGVIYALEGHHLLGRNETRLGTKLPNRDFCKLHIISHYLTVILSSANPEIKIYPIGAIGDDREGSEILDLFRIHGLSRKHVAVLPGEPTLSSICFQYPDGSGGNITESRSASSLVDIHFIRKILEQLHGESSIFFAVPEVPLTTRLFFLEIANKKKVWKAASFLSNEIRDVFNKNVFESLNLLAINMDEARALLSMTEEQNSDTVAKKCAELVLKTNPNIDLVISDGGNGLYGFKTESYKYYPALEVNIKNSAGAGDALFAGLIIGRILNLPFQSDTAISSIKFASCLAALSVESKDTINFDITYKMIKDFIEMRFL